MGDPHRDRRISDAGNLLEAIEQNAQDAAKLRQVDLHNRLMDAIDSICEDRKSNGRAVFDARQVLVIKDIAYRIVHLLDPSNKPKPESFRFLLFKEWRSLTPMKKIATTSTVLVFIIGSPIGIVAFYEKFIRSPDVVKSSENSLQVKPKE